MEVIENELALGQWLGLLSLQHSRPHEVISQDDFFPQRDRHCLLTESFYPHMASSCYIICSLMKSKFSAY
jgi:hypothetical protein